jgi:hypothetical protein
MPENKTLFKLQLDIIGIEAKKSPLNPHMTALNTEV